MRIDVSGGWTPDTGKNELDLNVFMLGVDEQDVKHLDSIVDDDWTIEGVHSEGGGIRLHVKATRRVTLEAQAEQKKAEEEAKAAMAAAAAEDAAAAAKVQSEKDARVQRLAAAAASAAVDAALKAEKS